ncbi:MAG: 2-phosphosulfolactate phosphatase [Calditrichaeota bacterium]|nr:2-phosphosulfolactate phosphatase [Calditrichota bacterium]
MARLEVALVPAEVRPRELRGRFVVVIDVLRAGTSVAVALANGASEVVPVASVRGAKRQAAALGRHNVLLCGERGGVRLPGFDLGNSPREYTRQRVAGRTLVFTSSNATYALARAREGGEVVLAGLVNTTEVARSAASSGRDITLVCAGRLRRFGVEDFFAAGILAAEIQSLLALDDGQLDDAALLAVQFAEEHREDPLGVLAASAHGQYLRSIGFEGDLPLCVSLDSIHVVPTLEGHALVPGARR